MAANVSTNYVAPGYATQEDKINNLISQYNANSDAAHAAQGNKGGAWENNATQLALRGQNDSIAQQLRDLGVSSSYDAATGQTNFTINKQQQPQNTYNLYAGTSGNGYIRDLYAESQAAAEAALKGAYDESVIALNAAKDKIPEYYQQGMNQAAANAAVAKNNMNEYFAASGLNTGAAGQSQLSMQNQYQQSLNDLNTAEANALKDIETERYQLEARYKNAIAEAIANNNLEQAKALYQEYIRVDNNLVENSRLQAQLDYQYATLNQNQSQFDANLALKAANATASSAGNGTYTSQSTRDVKTDLGNIKDELAASQYIEKTLGYKAGSDGWAYYLALWEDMNNQSNYSNGKALVDQMVQNDFLSRMANR